MQASLNLMINLKLWWESSDSKVSFQWKRTLLGVNTYSKTFPEDIFVVSKKVYIKLTWGLNLIGPVLLQEPESCANENFTVAKSFSQHKRPSIILRSNFHRECNSRWCSCFFWCKMSFLLFHSKCDWFASKRNMTVLTFLIWSSWPLTHH